LQTPQTFEISVEAALLAGFPPETVLEAPNSTVVSTTVPFVVPESPFSPDSPVDLRSHNVKAEESQTVEGIGPERPAFEVRDKEESEGGRPIGGEV